jgi:hypothetical protein
MAKKMLQTLRLPIPCKVYLLADSWYWAKELAQICRKYGYHMISQLKTTSVVFINGKKTKVTTLPDIRSAYREVSCFIYGKNKTFKIARFVGIIQGLGKVAVVVVKEKRKKTSYLVSTNLHLSALDIVKYYAKRWKIEQMIKDLKQRLGFGHYQVRNPQAIQRHVALALLSYCILILLKILQWLRDQNTFLDLSIQSLAFHVRKHILLENITAAFKTMRIQFQQNILDSYLEKLLEEDNLSLVTKWVWVLFFYTLFLDREFPPGLSNFRPLIQGQLFYGHSTSPYKLYRLNCEYKYLRLLLSRCIYPEYIFTCILHEIKPKGGEP